jgi:hypothetical protein
LTAQHCWLRTHSPHENSAAEQSSEVAIKSFNHLQLWYYGAVPARLFHDKVVLLTSLQKGTQTALPATDSG